MKNSKFSSLTILTILLKIFTLKLWGDGLPWCLDPMWGWGIARPFSINAGCIEPLEALKCTGVLSWGIWSKKVW